MIPVISTKKNETKSPNRIKLLQRLGIININGQVLKTSEHENYTSVYLDGEKLFTLRLYNKYVSLHLWTDTTEYQAKKIDYAKLDYEKSNINFLMGLLITNKYDLND